ncbi:MAG TPA: type II toxin-antitoxin system RelE/ParE family toxin [Kofleriaceae bacterium]|nr:type II toxin-antitoxin system RelE/ParE family toxin [Kofleriaceae bacterium]
MSYTVQVLSEADAEHAATITWFVEHVSHEHAITYATAISKALDELEDRPFAWPAWPSRPEVRVRHLREISYSIIYRVQDRVVTIIAFAHMHRAPGYWLGRLK